MLFARIVPRMSITSAPVIGSIPTPASAASRLVAGLSGSRKLPSR